MKLTKKIVIPVVAVALIGVAVFAVPRIVNGAGSKAATVSATPLAKMELENTVSVTGTVKSEDVTNIYSTLAYQIQSVNVEVGDKVNAGDVLCVLDTADLNATIDRQSATLANNQAKAQHNLAVAQNNLETEKYNQENNYDTQLMNAEKSVEQAEQLLVTRQSALESAKISLNSAEQKQRSNQKALRDYKDSYGTPKSGEYEEGYEQIYQAFVQGAISVTNAENAVADAERAVENAKKDIEDAKATFTAVKVQKEEALVSSQQQVQSARLNANLSDSVMQIDELKKDLDEAIIKAPVSGTVTAVLAVEGGSGQGLLFVIEDTAKLKIETKIKEYDLPNVKEGQMAIIKSDGTGDNEYEGKVSKIAPTALKAANGSTVETTDVQFATEIGIVGAGELKVGMNTRIDIVTEQKPSVFAVSYDAVVENENGESVVFVARPQTIVNAENGGGETGQDSESQQTNGSVIAVAVPVQTGMETDFYIEIISDSLNEGDLIISNPASIVDGQEVSLGGAAGALGAARQGGPGGGMAVRMG